MTAKKLYANIQTYLFHIRNIKSTKRNQKKFRRTKKRSVKNCKCRVDDGNDGGEREERNNGSKQKGDTTTMATENEKCSALTKHIEKWHAQEYIHIKLIEKE